MSTSLKEILKDLPFSAIIPSPLEDMQIKGVTFHTKLVRPGFLFVPLVGVDRDGHDFIPAAIEKGAIVVVGSRSDIQCSVPYIRVPETHIALAYLAAAFHGYPARKLTVIGVTGTDGKTTTCNLIHQILISADYKAGMISTVNALIGDQVIDTGFHVTTPDAPDVQAYLAKMVEAGITHVALEATSHGLAQDRVGACEFDIGVVTNITHEHLDIHGDYDHYLAAKAKLFTSLSETKKKARGNPRLAVLNKDDQSYAALKQLTRVRQIAYSVQSPAEIRAENIHQSQSGMHFDVSTPQGKESIITSLLGLFNVSNCLAAIGVSATALGIPLGKIAEGIASMPGVPGRMQLINLGQDFTAMVDFAHTPNALEQAIQTVRQITKGRVIVVFGSAGLRDRAKRRMMAEVAIRSADLSILTAEDPRTESLDDILAEMADAAVKAGGKEEKTFWRIPDRGNAMRKAVALAKPGDLVMACGKGHEQSMCFGEQEYPWDDRTALKVALSEKLELKSDTMPWLPTQENNNSG